MKAGLPLVGKIDVAVRCDMQIVASAKRFGIARRQYRLHPPFLHVELHDAVHVVGDEDPSVRANLETVGPAVIFCRQRPVAVRCNPEDAPERDIHDVEIAVGIE